MGSQAEALQTTSARQSRDGPLWQLQKLGHQMHVKGTWHSGWCKDGTHWLERQRGNVELVPARKQKRKNKA